EKIAGAFRSFGEERGFARVVGLDEVRLNDYNLNVTLYVMVDEEGEQIDITKEWDDLQEIDKERDLLKEKIETFLKEVNELVKTGRQEQ
ncbi:SAM-dependent DNA methyltransferase, partial [Candidatus Bathyarchaeota archaeon]|nr:SAM-dependent DNA methyltransferase [Candidatus Bathyarchaeota archaeon]